MVIIAASPDASGVNAGSALPPSALSARAVNVYVPFAARLMTSGWLLVLQALIAAMNAVTFPLGMLNTAGATRPSNSKTCRCGARRLGAAVRRTDGRRLTGMMNLGRMGKCPADGQSGR